MREFYKNLNTYDWAEELPDECPPDKTMVPEGELFYRLVSTLPPTEVDFLSHRALNPTKEYNTNECIARAVSILDSEKNCELMRKFPAQKNKRMVCFPLSAASGVIQQTGRNKGHYSWWRSALFDVLSLCRSIET